MLLQHKCCTHLVPSAHLTDHPKHHLDRMGRFSTIHGRNQWTDRQTDTLYLTARRDLKKFEVHYVEIDMISFFATRQIGRIQVDC